MSHASAFTGPWAAHWGGDMAGEEEVSVGGPRPKGVEARGAVACLCGVAALALRESGYTRSMRSRELFYALRDYNRSVVRLWLLW